MIWGLIASCMLCNPPEPMDGMWVETGWWETGGWSETGWDSGCDPWIALRDQDDVAVVSVDFGEVQGSESRSLTLLNRIEDCGSLQVSEVRVDGEAFSLDQGGATTLEPQESTQLILRFDPVQAGEAQGALVILSNDPFYPELTVPLSGTLPTLDLRFEPALLEFPETLVPCQSSASLRVENSGQEQVTLESMSLPEPFTLNTALPLSLEPEASADLEISFTPEAEGVYGGSIWLESDAGKLSAELSASATLGEPVEEETLTNGGASYLLASQPWEETLSVRVAGVPVETWVYEPETNTLRFNEDSTPDAGTRLTLRYVPVALCED